MSGSGGGGSGGGTAGGGSTSSASGVNGGIVRCTPFVETQVIAPPFCICDRGHGDELFSYVHLSVQGSRYCADCAEDTCVCICVHCDPDLVEVPEDDYDIDGHVYFNPATHNRINIDPPRCFRAYGDARCEFIATRDGFCDRCHPRLCMCPCRGCDPDDYNFDEHGQNRGRGANATPPQI